MARTKSHIPPISSVLMQLTTACVSADSSPCMASRNIRGIHRSWIVVTDPSAITRWISASIGVRSNFSIRLRRSRMCGSCLLDSCIRGKFRGILYADKLTHMTHADLHAVIVHAIDNSFCKVLNQTILADHGKQLAHLYFALASICHSESLYADGHFPLQDFYPAEQRIHARLRRAATLSVSIYSRLKARTFGFIGATPPASLSASSRRRQAPRRESVWNGHGDVGADAVQSGSAVLLEPCVPSISLRL